MQELFNSSKSTLTTNNTVLHYSRKLKKINPKYTIKQYSTFIRGCFSYLAYAMLKYKYHETDVFINIGNCFKLYNSFNKRNNHKLWKKREELKA